MVSCIFLICYIFVAEPDWQKLNDESEIFLSSYAYAIIFAFGAFTDIVLITGAARKDNTGLLIWCLANIFLIGPFCCLILPFLITTKSVDKLQIKIQENDH